MIAKISAGRDDMETLLVGLARLEQVASGVFEEETPASQGGVSSSSAMD
jgi:hypothetical protein